MENNKLTPREAQVLELRDNGLKNREIAAQLGISTATVKIHIKHIIDKGEAQHRSVIRRRPMIDGIGVVKLLSLSNSELLGRIRQLFHDTGTASHEDWAKKLLEDYEIRPGNYVTLDQISQ